MSCRSSISSSSITTSSLRGFLTTLRQPNKFLPVFFPNYHFTGKRSWLASQIFIALLYLCAPLCCLTVSTLSDSFHSTMSSKVHTCLTVSTLPHSDSFNRLNSDRVIGSLYSIYTSKGWWCKNVCSLTQT